MPSSGLTRAFGIGLAVAAVEGASLFAILPSLTRREMIAPRVRPCSFAMSAGEIPASNCSMSLRSSSSDHAPPAAAGCSPRVPTRSRP